MRLLSQRLAKIPERLLYDAMGEKRMFSTKTGDFMGYIKFHSIGEIKTKNSETYKSMYINDIFVVDNYRKQGVGKSLINLAKIASKERGANGNLHVVAYSIDHPGNPPHKFYRKLNFTTGLKEHDDLIDEAIKNNEPIPAIFTQGTTMFYKHKV